MLKRLTIAVAVLFALAVQVFAAGTIPGFSLTPQFDLTGKVAPGCRLYVIQAGTTSTPQQPYQDTGLTILAANPLLCDAAGRLPQWFVADGSIKVRLTKSDGTQIFVGDNLLVVGASSGGGGGSPVDPTTVIATGDVKPRYGTGVLSGFVRMNGRTIGSASSGATERANADCQALFEYLWGANTSLPVSGGRGVSANADWVANKTILVPDFRSRALAGLGDMGNTDNALFSGATFTFGNSTTLGALLGAARTTFAQANLPAVTWPTTLGLSNTLGLNDPAHAHGLSGGPFGGVNIFSVAAGGTGGLATASAITVNNAFTGITLTGGVALTGSVTSGGSGTPFDTVSPYALVTLYVKL